MTAAGASAQTVIYVDDSSTAVNPTGLSWSSAFKSLEDGLDAVLSPTSTEIWLAEGLYVPGVRFTSGTTTALQTDTFVVPSGLEIYGGFSGTETAVVDRTGSAALTILTGDLQRDGSDPNNAYHVVTVTAGDDEARLDRLTIRDGEADGAPSASDVDGGGIHCDRSDLHLDEVRLVENSAAETGGAVYFEGATGSSYGAGFRAERCDFSLNDAGDLGGAIQFEKVGIPAEASAGISVDEPSWIFSSTFSRNSGGAAFAATGVGGGAINIEDRIARTSIVDTSSDPDDFEDFEDLDGYESFTGSGSDPTPQDQSLTLEISNSEFRGNITDGLGTSIRIVPASTTDGGRIIIRQCTMAGDSWTSDDTVATMDSSTIYQTGTESGPSAPNMYYLDLRTTFIVGSIVMAPNALPTTNSGLNAIDGPAGVIGAGSAFETNGIAAIASDVQQASGALLHPTHPDDFWTINDDPEFANFGVGNLRLTSGSPCIDEGGSAGGIFLSRDYPDLDEDLLTTRLPLDLDDLTRVIDAGGGANVDMGAFEYDEN